MRILLTFLVLLGAGVAWYVAGRAPGPTIEIASPTGTIGQKGEMLVNIDAPGGQLSRLDIVLEQGDRRMQLFALSEAGPAQLTREGDRGIGDVEYRGFPASGAGVANADPAARGILCAAVESGREADQLAAHAVARS